MHIKIIVFYIFLLSRAALLVAEGKPLVDEVTAKARSEFPIEVFENGTTGYLWFALTQGDQDPVKLVRKESVPEPKSEEMIVGRGHNVRFIFRAKKEGSYLINLVYKRLWEDGIAEYKTVRVNITA